MKRKHIDELFSDLAITDKKIKAEKLYTENEVKQLLLNQEELLTSKFLSYLSTFRENSSLNIPLWNIV